MPRTSTKTSFSPRATSSLHVPLVESTYHFIGEDELRQMSEDAILLNTSRGSIVDTEAVDDALEHGGLSV